MTKELTALNTRMISLEKGQKAMLAALQGDIEKPEQMGMMQQLDNVATRVEGVETSLGDMNDNVVYKGECSAHSETISGLKEQVPKNTTAITKNTTTISWMRLIGGALVAVAFSAIVSLYGLYLFKQWKTTPKPTPATVAGKAS